MIIVWVIPLSGCEDRFITLSHPFLLCGPTQSYYITVLLHSLTYDCAILITLNNGHRAHQHSTAGTDKRAGRGRALHCGKVTVPLERMPWLEFFISYSPCRLEHSSVQKRLLCTGCEKPFPILYHRHHQNPLFCLYVLVTFSLDFTLFLDLPHTDGALNSFNMKYPTRHANDIQIQMQTGCKNDITCGEIKCMHVQMFNFYKKT